MKGIEHNSNDENIWKMKNKDSPERYLYLANNEYHDVRNHFLVQLSAGRNKYGPIIIKINEKFFILKYQKIKELASPFKKQRYKKQLYHSLNKTVPIYRQN